MDINKVLRGNSVHVTRDCLLLSLPSSPGTLNVSIVHPLDSAFGSPADTVSVRLRAGRIHGAIGASEDTHRST